MSAFQNVIPRCHRGCVVTVVCPPYFTDRAAAHYVVAYESGVVLLASGWPLQEKPAC